MRYILIAAALLALTACEHQIPPSPAAPNFMSTVYRFNVADIKVIQDYIAPRRTPNVEHLAEISPADAVKKWAASNLVVAGKEGTLEVDIKDASVVRKELPKQKTGIEGFFTKEQTEEYDGKITVTIKIYSSRRILPVANIEVNAYRTITLREDSTALDRKQLYNQMTIDLMNGLSVELDKNIHQYLSNYLL